uniref:Secreted protein n=1 Tax=Lepeophtheirus salmonis TaxID=72036 RepID=A0A0K2TER9_LEPSM
MLFEAGLLLLLTLSSSPSFISEDLRFRSSGLVLFSDSISEGISSSSNLRSDPPEISEEASKSFPPRPRPLFELKLSTGLSAILSPVSNIIMLYADILN